MGLMLAISTVKIAHNHSTLEISEFRNNIFFHSGAIRSSNPEEKKIFKNVTRLLCCCLSY
ncbi:hypothetical protein BpHYR1_047222 [Brachionus plicatilis]|uniref:Uncharacterized protein n=1 Tax=Brachionus plicatilis TaxID=10195 RepID=A0A3M7T506_BRAPC|nr:hypothetical protein BpHYR1_047222 [Brachionus plicatilis]